MFPKAEIIALLTQGYTQRYVSRKLKVPMRTVGEVARAANVGRRPGDTRKMAVARVDEATLLLNFANTL